MIWEACETYFIQSDLMIEDDLHTMLPQNSLLPSFDYMDLLIDLERRGHKVWAHLIHVNRTLDRPMFVHQSYART